MHVERAKNEGKLMNALDNQPPLLLQPRPLRAMIELTAGELKIYPIADSEEQTKQIIDSLLAWKRNA